MTPFPHFHFHPTRRQNKVLGKEEGTGTLRNKEMRA